MRGEWMLGAAINVLGSIGINLGTNLLKLGHNQRDREAATEASQSGEKILFKRPIVQFQVWRVGILVFTLGNCLNFFSFGYAAQSLLAALGSVQFISNVAFAYFVLEEVVTLRIVLATVCIVVGNMFFVAFGNHQSPIFTPEELLINYKNHVYLLYCAVLILIVIAHHMVYRKGCEIIANKLEVSVSPQWKILLPYCYAIVSGAIGTHSVLFAKSLSILLRLTLNGESQLNGWFTYVILLLFFFTASFWMARLNDGLAMFDAILIVPMLQIFWTTFSIFTGFVYFQEYRVFDEFQACMFGIGICFLFLGIALLAPEDQSDFEQSSADVAESLPLMKLANEQMSSPFGMEANTKRSILQHVLTEVGGLMIKAKTAYKSSLGFGQDEIPTSSVFTMPMLSSSRNSWRRKPSTYVELFTLENDEDIESPFSTSGLVRHA